jgi:hypothetical protein
MTHKIINKCNLQHVLISHLFVLLLGVVFIVFAACRNEWVYQTRVKIIREDATRELENQRFNHLPSYDSMMLHFWIWDVEEFIK